MDIPEGAIIIEVRSIYDGWSILQMPDGSLINRWPESDRRHKPTQDVIKSMKDRQK